MEWTKRQYQIAWNMIPGIGGRRLQAIEAHFGSLARAWNTSAKTLASVEGIGPKTAQGFVSARPSVSPLQEEKWAQGLGARIITTSDQAYPDYLRRLVVPPPVLYVVGTLPKEAGIAVVGTRRPSVIGIAQAKQFTAHLVRQGKTIISGFARGIDYFAHRQAMEANGMTVAVLGSNLGNIYPREHKSLVKQVAKDGAVVSEFSSRCSTVRGNFPRRNRIIAGCSTGVLVVQAGARSGALVTADWALELGLDVWAIPGEISDPLREGTHRLIQQGAHLLTTPHELTGCFADQQPVASSRLQELYRAGHHANEIAAQLEMPIEQVLSKITVLQVVSKK